MTDLSRWCRTWGATAHEVRGAMLGDGYVTLPSYEATFGVTIDAALGGRLALAAADGLPARRVCTATTGSIASSVISTHRAPNGILPRVAAACRATKYHSAEARDFRCWRSSPTRSLVLGGCAGDVEWSWEFQLTPQAGGSTRLVSRNRVWTRNDAARASDDARHHACGVRHDQENAARHQAPRGVSAHRRAKGRRMTRPSRIAATPVERFLTDAGR